MNENIKNNQVELILQPPEIDNAKIVVTDKEIVKFYTDILNIFNKNQGGTNE